MPERFSAPVRDWFKDTFGVPTPPQKEGWPAIASGSDTLICAPTGSGKTLSAFLWSIDELVKGAAYGDLPDETAATELGLPEIRVAVRTGDTPASERTAMLKRPPHILITTPESLYILLTADKSRRFL